MMKQNVSWELCLITFGMFMIMSSPIMGYLPFMITGGIFFVVLGFILIQRKKKRSKK